MSVSRFNWIWLSKSCNDINCKWCNVWGTAPRTEAVPHTLCCCHICEKNRMSIAVIGAPRNLCGQQGVGGMVEEIRFFELLLHGPIWGNSAPCTSMGRKNVCCSRTWQQVSKSHHWCELRRANTSDAAFFSILLLSCLYVLAKKYRQQWLIMEDFMWLCHNALCPWKT